MILLGIETSCDETSASVISSDQGLLSNIVLSQSTHRIYGGVVPEIAAREHLDAIDKVVKSALVDSKIDYKDIDYIASTVGPGLIGGLIVGALFGKSLALSLEVPFIPVNHLQAHALSAKIENDIEYPFLLLLISGGHCQIVIVESLVGFKIISTTIDDSPGEVFDKIGRELGLGYPAGALIEQRALNVNNDIFNLPKPMRRSKNPNFSFSGLKTAANQIILKSNIDNNFINHMSFSLQEAIGGSIIDRLSLALKTYQSKGYKNNSLVIVGGVAANQRIRNLIKELAIYNNFQVFFPSIEYCTDNAAMIANTALEIVNSKYKDKFIEYGKKFIINPRWQLNDIKDIL